MVPTLVARRAFPAAIILAALLAIGCAGTAVRPADLKQVTAKPSLRLPRHFVYQGQNGQTTLTVVAGEYVARYEDAAGGTYYFGPSPSVWYGDTAGFYQQALADGGIYVPASPSEPWKVVLVMGNERRAPPVGKASPAAPVEPTAATPPGAVTAPGSDKTVGGAVGNALGNVLVNAIIAMDNGKLMFSLNQPDPQELRRAFGQ